MNTDTYQNALESTKDSIEDVNSAIGFSLGNLTLEKLITSAITLVICVLVIWLVMRVARRISAHSRLSESLSRFILKVLKIALEFMAILIVADSLGFNVTALLAVFSPLIPDIYNTEPAIRELASSVIRTAALCMPLFAFANAAYFTLRSGGKTLITFFFDSCYTWLINFPIAFVLSRYTALPLPIVYLFVNGVDLLKCIIGFILVKKGVWVNNIVASSQDVPQAD